MILEAVNSRLQSSAELEAIVGEKIYPIVIDQDAKAPAVAFNSTTSISHDKSSAYIDDNIVEIVCVSPKYKEAAEISNIIRNLFDRWAGIVNNIRIISSKVTDITRAKDMTYKEYAIVLSINIKSKLI